MTMEIPLTQGEYAIVDDDDYDYLMQWKWSVLSPGTGKNKLYAARALRKGEPGYVPKWKMRMHHAVVGEVTLVDHKNGDGLDNRRSNLRVATIAQNNYNLPARGFVPFKGVRVYGDQFTAHIVAEGTALRLGIFDTEEEAAHAYDAAARVHHAEFAYLNFPEER